MEGQPCHLGSQNGPCTLASEPPGDQDPRLLAAPTAAESEVLGAGPSIFWPFSYTLTFVSPTQLDQGVLLCHWDRKPLPPTGLSHWLSNHVAEEIDTFPMACECVSHRSAHDCSPTNAVGPFPVTVSCFPATLASPRRRVVLPLLDSPTGALFPTAGGHLQPPPAKTPGSRLLTCSGGS